MTLGALILDIVGDLKSTNFSIRSGIGSTIDLNVSRRASIRLQLLSIKRLLSDRTIDRGRTRNNSLRTFKEGNL